jgi:hypothetical protein
MEQRSQELQLVPVGDAALVGRTLVGSRAARAHHRRALGVDELGRVGVAVLVGLDAAAWVVRPVERVYVALLPGGPRRAVLPREESSEHAQPLPDRRYTKRPAGPIRLAA